MTKVHTIPVNNLLSLNLTKQPLKKVSAEDLVQMQEAWKGQLAKTDAGTSEGAYNALAVASQAQNGAGAISLDEGVEQSKSTPVISLTKAAVNQANQILTSDATAKTKSDTQIIAQSGNADTSDSTLGETSVVDKFMAFMDAAKEGPAAFFRAQYLASKGLSEKDVSAMSPEDQNKLQKEIEDFIKKKVAESNAKSGEKQATSDGVTQDVSAKDDASSKDQQAQQQSARIDTKNKSGNGIVSELAGFI